MAKSTDRTIQFNLLLQQKYSALNMIDKSNDVLDDKAAKTIQASSLVIALTGLLASPLVGATLSSTSMVLVALIMIAFMAMIGLSISSIFPTAHYIPGSQDWKKNFEQYILVNAEETFNHVLSDCMNNIDLLLKTNGSKARFVKVSNMLLLSQVGALLVIIFLSVK